MTTRSDAARAAGHRALGNRSVFCSATSSSPRAQSFDRLYDHISRTIARTDRGLFRLNDSINVFRFAALARGLSRIIGMKTGSLFACAAELGALISGAPTAVVRRMKNYGAKIGTAYQIYDDCLDIAGTEAETGKTLGTDLRKGKLTLPVLSLLESASAFDRERCCALAGRETGRSHRASAKLAGEWRARCLGRYRSEADSERAG